MSSEQPSELQRGRVSKAAPRYAIYFTPPRGSPLERFGAAALGYDAHTGDAVPRQSWIGLEDKRLDEITAEPRRYGFHATLKAPFRLGDGCTPGGLADAVRSLAASYGVIPIGRLKPVLLGSFVALVPELPSRALDLLAAECVASFDCFRAPLDDAERERRRCAELTLRQSVLLERWGYPYVFEEFRFHMSLTGALPKDERETWLRQLSSAFKAITEPDIVVDALTLLRQEPGAFFRVIERFPFLGSGHGG